MKSLRERFVARLFSRSDSFSWRVRERRWRLPRCLPQPHRIREVDVTRAIRMHAVAFVVALSNRATRAYFDGMHSEVHRTLMHPSRSSKKEPFPAFA